MSASAETTAPLQVAVIPVTPLQQNASLIWCTKTKQAAVVDAGGDVPRLKAAIEKTGVTLTKVLLTHGHFDHAGGAAELAALYGVPVEGPHRADDFLLADMANAGARWGVPGGKPVTPDRWLAEGDTVTVGEVSFDVYHCPGHTPGHVVFVQPEVRFALVGDVIFAGSVGRTDFSHAGKPYGDQDLLVRMIREKLFPLGDDITFLPGHGPASTFGAERATNPYCGDRMTA